MTWWGMFSILFGKEMNAGELYIWSYDLIGYMREAIVMFVFGICRSFWSSRLRLLIPVCTVSFCLLVFIIHLSYANDIDSSWYKIKAFISSRSRIPTRRSQAREAQLFIRPATNTPAGGFHLSAHLSITIGPHRQRESNNRNESRTDIFTAAYLKITDVFFIALLYLICVRSAFQQIKKPLFSVPVCGGGQSPMECSWR